MSTRSRMLIAVAALALLMPVDMQAAKKAGRSPSLSLMPLSFASILGGMITLIGTPPNIVIAEYRGSALGEPYRMFDFAPVGLAVAAVGVVYVALLGWRLIPAVRGKHDAGKELFELASYVAEVVVPKGSATIGKKVNELDDTVNEHGVDVIGLVRRGTRQPGRARRVEIRAGDVLVLKAEPRGIEGLVGDLRVPLPPDQCQAVLDVGLQFLAIQRAQVIAGDDALANLFHALTLQGLLQFELAEQETLQQRLTVFLVVREHAQLLDRPARQVLCLIDDQQDPPSQRRRQHGHGQRTGRLDHLAAFPDRSRDVLLHIHVFTRLACPHGS